MSNPFRRTNITDPPEPVIFWVETMFGNMSKQPYVRVQVIADHFDRIMTPDEATELAHNLLAAAEAARVEAFFYDALKMEVREGKTQINKLAFIDLVRRYRHWRDETRRVSDAE